MYNPIQSFKQITVDGPASRAGATDINHRIVLGVDNYTGPSGANDEVPTGAKISSVTVMATFSVLSNVSSLLHFHIMLLRSGMTGPSPGGVGGNPLRNTVIHTKMTFIGFNQNTGFTFRFKVPSIYQRIREGDNWFISYRADTTFASATQAIYKFYR